MEEDRRLTRGVSPSVCRGLLWDVYAFQGFFMAGGGGIAGGSFRTQFTRSEGLLRSVFSFPEVAV